MCLYIFFQTNRKQIFIQKKLKKMELCLILINMYSYIVI